MSSRNSKKKRVLLSLSCKFGESDRSWLELLLLFVRLRPEVSENQLFLLGPFGLGFFWGLLGWGISQQ